MIKRWVGLAAFLCCAGFADLAHACSCMGISDAGFVHAKVKRLPANARGALFLPPEGSLRRIARVDSDIWIYKGKVTQLSPASFTITSSAERGALPAVLSWPDLSRGAEPSDTARSFTFARKEDEAGASKLVRGDIERLVAKGVLIEITAEHKAAYRLTRVGPAGGFKRGARYTITYAGEARNWAYPSSVTHAIDSAPLAAATVDYGLVLDGAPGEKLLPMSTMSGACSSEEPALVQDFHYRLPAPVVPYRDALLFFSEIRPDAAPGKAPHRFAATEYSPSLCGPDEFAGTAYGGGKDMVYAQCGDKPGRASVRGWAGILEVEDQLHPVAAVQVDLGKAAEAVCISIDKKLNDAFASGDAGRVKRAVCAFGGKEEREFHAGPEPFGAQFPTASLLALATSDDQPLQSCAAQALVRVFAEAPKPEPASLALYRDSIKADLLAPDTWRVKRALRTLGEFVQRSRHMREIGEARSQAVLVPLVDALVDVLIHNKAPHTAELSYLIGLVEEPARRHVPAMLAVAPTAPGWNTVVTVLQAIAPDDPRFHQLLLNGMKYPERRELSTLVYSRVVLKENR